MSTNNMSEGFDFINPGELIDADLRLMLTETGYKGPQEDRFLFYRFTMSHIPDGEVMGGITLRIGDAKGVLKEAGHIGFDVSPSWRGCHYAERSTRLLFPLAMKFGLKELWIGCSQDNVASRRTCERLGGILAEIMDVPEGIDLYTQGIRHLCRYCITMNDRQ
jgi:tagatose 1,6-diphosphate aldolase